MTFVQIISFQVDASRAAAGVRKLFETNVAPDGLFAEGVDFSLVMPGGRLRGDRDVMVAALVADAASREFSLYDWKPTPDGFAGEYAYRATNADGEAHTNVGMIVAELHAGQITRFSVSCAGDWPDEKVEAVVAKTGAFGPRDSGQPSLTPAG